MDNVFRTDENSVATFIYIYLKPIFQLATDNVMIKSFIAIVASLMAAPEHLVVYVMILWLLDFLTGAGMAIKREGWKAFRPAGFLWTMGKVVTHIITILIFTGFANAFEVQQIQTAVFGFIAAHEITSIMKNLWGDKQGYHIIQTLRKRASRSINELFDAVEETSKKDKEKP